MSTAGLMSARPGPVAVAGGLAAGFVLLALLGPLAAPTIPWRSISPDGSRRPASRISSAPTISAATSSRA